MMNSRNFSFLVAILLMALAIGCTNITGTCTGKDCPDDPPIEKEGPGEITLGNPSCSDAGEATGEIIVFVANGYEVIGLEDETGERVPGLSSDGFTPQDDQKHIFSTVPAGSYYVVAKKNGKESRSELITVDECEVEKLSPTAQCEFTKDGLTVNFDASQSSDPDGDIVSYDWTFGDGNEGSGVNPEHTYAESDSYEVAVTATDNDGLTDTATCGDVTVEQTMDNFEHEINLEDGWHAVSAQDKKDILQHKGAVRPILRGGKNPVGTVEFEMFYHLDKDEADENFSVQFTCGDNNRKFSTGVIWDKESVNGWTSSSIEFSAEKFKYREMCEITAHSEGDGEVIISTEKHRGKYFFRWSVPADGGQAKVMQRMRSIID